MILQFGDYDFQFGYTVVDEQTLFIESVGEFDTFITSPTKLPLSSLTNLHDSQSRW